MNLHLHHILYCIDSLSMAGILNVFILIISIMDIGEQHHSLHHAMYLKMG